jgi:hypothetical protein
MADIVDDFLTRLQQHVPSVAPETRLQLESSLRQSWGGTEPYVGKRLSSRSRTWAVANGLRRALPLREVFQSAGVGRSTGYNILKSK